MNASMSGSAEPKMSPVELLVSRLEELLSPSAAALDPPRASEASRLLGPELGTLCDRGLVSREELRRVEDLVQAAPVSLFERLMILASISGHYAEAQHPDDADRVIREAVPRLGDLTVASDLDQILHVLAFALDNLNQTERADELRARVVSLRDDDQLEAFWRDVLPGFDDLPGMMQRRRHDAFFTLVERCEEDDDDSVAELHEALLAQDGLSPLYRALGWRHLSAVWAARGDRGRMWAGLFNAWDAISSVATGQADLAGQLALEISERYLADADQRLAGVWLRTATDLFFGIRDSAGDPTLRRSISDDVDWSDALIFHAFSVQQQGRALFRCLAGAAAHGLEGLLRSAGPSESERSRSIVDRFAASWAPIEADPWEFAAALPPRSAALHARLVRRGDATYVVGQSVVGDDLYSTRSVVSPALLRRTFPVTASRALTLRRRDWEAWADLLLVSEVLDPGRGIDTLVVALAGELATLPVTHLPVPGGRVLDRFTVHTVPLLPLWEQLPKTQVKVASVVYVGVDSAENPVTGLPGVDEEVRLLGSLDADVRQVRSLTELMQAPRCDVWVFSMHGRVEEGRNVFLFPDGTPVPSDTLADLRVAPILVGATCWSGSLHADPSPFGMVPAALLGGARALILTMWDAETQHVHDILARLFPRLIAGESVAVALAAAQRDIDPGGRTPAAMAALAR